jgi:hypothetical protein
MQHQNAHAFIQMCEKPTLGRISIIIFSQNINNTAYLENKSS